MSEQVPIRIWNRSKNREEPELVYGEGAVRLLYGSRMGQLFADKVLSRPICSRVYGAYQASAASRKKIEPFIADFKIDMREYEPGPFGSFNDFFIRRFRDGARTFVSGDTAMPAFAEARYFGFESAAPGAAVPVKGNMLNRAQLVGADEARPFQDGPILVARLCPTDYHRYHYPDSGKTLKAYTLHGPLHSVNPLALEYNSEILSTNERRVALLETKNFGRLAYVEVGALCVGKIVQTHSESDPFVRGAEKGYFLFGGSTVVLLGEKGAWRPSQDVLDQTARGIETLVRLGEEIANR